MTTNTNAKPAARFFAAAAPTEGLYPITDRTDGTIVAAIKGRAAARTMAATLTAFDPAPREADDVKPAKARKPKAEPKPTAHAACSHAATKLARAICRREARKAEAPADAPKADA